MAIYHLHAQMISRSDGRSAVACAAYRSGQAIEDERTGQAFDYTRKQTVEESHIVAPGNAPEWATDRAQLWNEVERAETRKNSQLAREMDIALPKELSEEQRRELVLEYARTQFVSRGMVADVSIHSAPEKGDLRNHHAHIMLTTREIDPEGFGAKNRSWNDRSFLQDARERWAELANRHLERAGHEARIDHRTLAAQREDALDRGEYERAIFLAHVPQEHRGVVATNMQRFREGSERIEEIRERQPERNKSLLEYREARKDAAEALQTLQEAKKQESAIQKEIEAVKPEFDRRRAGVDREIAAEEAAAKKEPKQIKPQTLEEKFDTVMEIHAAGSRRPARSAEKPEPPKQKAPIERAREDRDYFYNLQAATDREWQTAIKSREKEAAKLIIENQADLRREAVDQRARYDSLTRSIKELQEEAKKPFAIFRRKELEHDIELLERHRNGIVGENRILLAKINEQLERGTPQVAAQLVARDNPELAQRQRQVAEVRGEWERRDYEERQKQQRERGRELDRSIEI